MRSLTCGRGRDGEGVHCGEPKDLRSAKRCRHCILGMVNSAYSRPEPCKLETYPLPLKYWDSSEIVHASNCGTLASDWPNTSSPKFYDNRSLLI
jgi:hypothetical protein